MATGAEEAALADAVDGVAPLTDPQRERRQRILAAAQQLASRGGFDGVQMREVAEKADVALGTLYRYFSSKVHLLVALAHDRTALLADRLRLEPPTDPDPVERVTVVLHRTTHALQRDPSLAEAMIRALMIADASAAGDVDRVSRLVTAIIVDAMHGAPDSEPTDEDAAVSRVLEHVWISSILAWLSGRSSTRQVDDDLAMAARLVLR